MRRGRRGALALLVLSVAGGCVNTKYVQTGVAYPARSADCEIEVFSGEPRGAYEEIGILEGEGSLWKADLEDMIPKLKEEACRAGGDGLILRSAQRYHTGENGLGDVEMYAFATVIRWSR
jgi:hypothetical protein